jgi:predicted XRE-type DNA-binding protein
MNKNTKKELEYQKYLQELDDPNYQGGSWSLPENATPLEQAKYDICRQVVIYKLDTKISTSEIAQKLQLSKAETEDILYYRIDYFTLDRLVEYATRLFKPLAVKMLVEGKKTGKKEHERVI